MRIAVFNYENNSLDIGYADSAFIDEIYNGDVESYLRDYVGYNMDNIVWMSGFKSVNFFDNDLLNQIE